MGCAMSQDPTTAAIQRYLDAPTGDSPAEPIIRGLLNRAVRRLPILCATLLHPGYPRLTHPPMNLQVEELLSAVAERLLKALREIRPQSVRQFFALADHMLWELNNLARCLDEQSAAAELRESQVMAPASSGSGLTADGRRILAAIENLPEDEREVFRLMRIQGMTQTEPARGLGVTLISVKRRLNCGPRLLTEQLADLRPSEQPPD
jgi:RNA polymerase sigma-70 factor (ECF subfamily)